MKKIWIMVIVLLLGAVVIWFNIDSKVEYGEYLDNDGVSQLSLKDDSEFSLIRPAASMVLEGWYEINGKMLILHSDYGEYDFLILGNKLIFVNETSEVSALIDRGATYYYKSN